MDISSVAAMSVSMHSAQLQQDVGVAVMKKAMDQTAQAGDAMVQMIAASTSRGHALDILA